MTYDVLVIGGGISGSMAAISAAREGCKVLLVERYGNLGGTLTSSGTGPMMTFHAGERQVVKGITGELIDRLQKKGKSPGHIFDTTCVTYTVTPFEAEAMKRELEIMLLEAGGEVLYHSFVCSVNHENEKIKSVNVCGKDGIKEIAAKVFIDASGDADISRFSEQVTHLGRTEDNKCQPVTMNMKVCNVDIDKVKEYIKNNPHEFPTMDVNKIDAAPRMSVGGYKSIFRKAIKDGKITFEREDILFFETNIKGEVIVNTTRVSGINPLIPEELSKAEIEGRRQCEEVFTFLQESIDGFQNAQLEYTGPFIGVRGSAQIDGEYTLTETDLVTYKEFPDTIAHGAYNIDVHPPEGLLKDLSGVMKIEKGKYYSIPYRCLIGKMKNLITVGRCISATFEAQGAIRVSPIAGAIGHAGGVAAALTVKENIDVQNVNSKKLQTVLKSQGAFI